MIDNTQSKHRFRIIMLVELMLIIAVWQVLSMAQIIPKYLSNPIDIGKVLWGMTVGGEIFLNAGVSLYRSLIGFFLVILIGTTLGIAAGYSERIGRFFDPLVALFNPIPKIALLPIFMVWFGITDVTRILIIFATAIFPCFIATYDGVKSVNKVYIWSAKNMGASNLQILWKIILLAALSKIFDGYRVALALTFVMMFSSEIIGSSSGLGLGLMILSADIYGRTDIMFAAIFVIALLGFFFDRILLAARSRILWWSNK